MPKEDADKNESLLVEISIATAKDKRPPDVRVYLFDAAGRLTHSVKARERVELRIDPQQRYRVTVGPDLMKEGKPAPADLNAWLVKAGAISQDYLPQNPLKISVSLPASLRPVDLAVNSWKP